MLVLVTFFGDSEEGCKNKPNGVEGLIYPAPAGRKVTNK
jgi:hypothetical protein